jgi:hypothetical protein
MTSTTRTLAADARTLAAAQRYGEEMSSASLEALDEAPCGPWDYDRVLFRTGLERHLETDDEELLDLAEERAWRAASAMWDEAVEEARELIESLDEDTEGGNLYAVVDDHDVVQRLHWSDTDAGDPALIATMDRIAEGRRWVYCEEEVEVGDVLDVDGNATRAMVTWMLRYEPEDVEVSDERGTVAGARVWATDQPGASIEGTVIPPEGDGVDCWVSPGDLLALTDDAALVDALAEAAREGAAGRDGRLEVEVLARPHDVCR